MPSRRKRVLLAPAYYDHRMHRGAARYAREANWVLDARMGHYGTLPDDWKGDGILALPLPTRPDLSRYLRKAQVPIVALTADVERLTATRVLTDNFRIGQLAAEHLLERGFRHRAFKHYVGRTICQELERKRIEQAQHLLLTSSDKVLRIAHQCGFPTSEQFCRTFARVTGTTPTAFRQAGSSPG